MNSRYVVNIKIFAEGMLNVIVAPLNNCIKNIDDSRGTVPLSQTIRYTEIALEVFRSNRTAAISQFPVVKQQS